MSCATVAAPRRSVEVREARNKNSYNKTGNASGIILSGIARLLVGQRRFAEELGLPYDRVFAQECQIFRDKDPEAVLLEWLRDKIDGPEKVSRLINDLVEHNLALYAALDGVALESISRLSPKAVKKRSFSILGWRPFAWLTFRRIHRSYTANDYLRHQEMVVTGFAKAYCTARETFRKSKSPFSKTSTPKIKTARKDHDIKN